MTLDESGRLIVTSLNLAMSMSAPGLKKVAPYWHPCELTDICWFGLNSDHVVWEMPLWPNEDGGDVKSLNWCQQSFATVLSSTM